VDPSFGDLASFQHLVRAVHSRGMKNTLMRRFNTSPRSTHGRKRWCARNRLSRNTCCSTDRTTPNLKRDLPRRENIFEVAADRRRFQVYDRQICLSAMVSLNRDAVAAAIEATVAKTPPGKGQLIFLENHDTIRFASAVQGPELKRCTARGLASLLVYQR
jgi:hypothetical protein